MQRLFQYKLHPPTSPVIRVPSHSMLCWFCHACSAIGRARASDVTITKEWAWPTDFVWQKSMEVYGKPLTTATSVVAKLPSVRLCSKKLLHRFQGGIGNPRTVETTGPAFPLTSMQFSHTFATRFIDHAMHVQAPYCGFLQFASGACMPLCARRFLFLVYKQSPQRSTAHSYMARYVDNLRLHPSRLTGFHP